METTGPDDLGRGSLDWPDDSDGEPFRNDPVDPATLPSVPDELFEPLDPRYLRLRWMGDGVAAAIVVVVAAVATILVRSPVPRWLPGLIALGVLALIALTAWMQWLEVNRLGYLIRDKDFSFRRGVIGRSVTTVPFARIQHVSIDRGPLARAVGLATLQMRTAGDSGLTVPGISHEAAQRLKALVVDRAGALADDELAGTQTGESFVPPPVAPPPPPQVDQIRPGPAVPGSAAPDPMPPDPAGSGSP